MRPGLLLWLLPLLVQFFFASAHDPDNCLGHKADQIAHQHDAEAAREHEHHAHVAQHEDAQHEDAQHEHQHDASRAQDSVPEKASHHHGAQVSSLARADGDCASCQWLSAVSFDRAGELAQNSFSGTKAPLFQAQSSFSSRSTSAQHNRGPPPV